MVILRKIKTFCHIWDTKRFLRNIKFLIENDIQTVHANLKDEAIEDCVFELDELREFLLPFIPKILNNEESLALLESQPKSFARFGDGEINIMQGKDIGFQKYDPVLAEKMLKVLKTKRDDLYIGLNIGYFHAVNPMTTNEVARMFRRNYSSGLRRFFMRETNPEIQYLSALCLTGLFTRQSEEPRHEKALRKMKLFEGRKIAVVTGRSVLAKLDYDIFALSSSKIIIDAPSKNAFSVYDDILREISRNVSKDTMIHLILGPTGTVMAADLTDMGYLAWDSGHMAKDYDFYMKNVERNSQAQLDFFAPD